MFTGIVEAIGTIVNTSGHELFVQLPKMDAQHGDSIAINGCCLTISHINAQANIWKFDVSPETLSLTNLGDLRVGSRVNLERAVTLSTRLGGHLVSGHIDGLGEVASVTMQEASCQLELKLPSRFDRYVIKKGSIGLDGVSLTINDIRASVPSGEELLVSFTLIPTTLAGTTFNELRVGQKLNVEYDLIGKYIEKLVRI